MFLRQSVLFDPFMLNESLEPNPSIKNHTAP
jgi:hypothetical protein